VSPKQEIAKKNRRRGTLLTLKRLGLFKAVSTVLKGLGERSGSDFLDEDGIVQRRNGSTGRDRGGVRFWREERSQGRVLAVWQGPARGRGADRKVRRNATRPGQKRWETTVLERRCSERDKGSPGEKGAGASWGERCWGGDRRGWKSGSTV